MTLFEHFLVCVLLFTFLHNYLTFNKNLEGLLFLYKYELFPRLILRVKSPRFFGTSATTAQWDDIIFQNERIFNMSFDNV